MIKFKSNNWIGKPGTETIFILALPFICCLIVLLLPKEFIHTENIPPFMWLFLVVFIDVAHVYSTMYRTYADKELVLKHKNLFFGFPVLLLIASILLHSINFMLFWKCLAYLAVFHFIRQQYGFLRIYSRKNNYSKSKQLLDTITIYGVTILPVLYWHFSGDRNFTWFIKGDFFEMEQHPLILLIIQILFWGLSSVYLISEIITSVKDKEFNLQKNSIIIGTALSWYIGIVVYNSDMVFTFLNVICHGVPYMALVWIHGKKTKTETTGKSFFKLLYGRFSLILFLLPILLLAYFEEGLWDVLVWRDHGQLFFLPGELPFTISKSFMNIVVPLLSLPQLFHYVIDGFIWKLKHDKFEWVSILE